jgi:hypothetical protein
MAQSKEPSGVLVLRAWVEGGSPGGLRARITKIRELDESRTEAAAASLDQILAIVRAWLESLLLEAPSPPSQSGGQPVTDLHEWRSREENQ